MNDCITTTKQSTTKPCEYLLGYTVRGSVECMKITIWMLFNSLLTWCGSITFIECLNKAFWKLNIDQHCDTLLHTHVHYLFIVWQQSHVACYMIEVSLDNMYCYKDTTLLWRHNEHDSVSNHQPRGCLLNRLFRRRSKKTPKLRVTGLCVGNSPGPVNSPHKEPVTRKMFPFDDVIMTIVFICNMC